MYNDILLAVDLNRESSWKKALPLAVEYSKVFGSRLHIVTVVPDFGFPLIAGYFPEGFEKTMREAANKRLHALVSEQVPTSLTVQHIIAEGTPYKEILRVAEEVGADIIVMASHHPGLQDYFLGQNSERVVRHAKASVLIVRE